LINKIHLENIEPKIFLFNRISTFSTFSTFKKGGAKPKPLFTNVVERWWLLSIILLKYWFGS